MKRKKKQIAKFDGIHDVLVSNSVKPQSQDETTFNTNNTALVNSFQLSP